MNKKKKKEQLANGRKVVNRFALSLSDSLLSLILVNSTRLVKQIAGL